MRRRTLITAGVLAHVPTGTMSQQKRTPRRVALVFLVTPLAEMLGPNPSNPLARAFVHGLRDLGLVEDRNIIIERRSAEDHPERLPELMRELVARGVDVIVTNGRGVAAAKQATDTIPIVGLIADPTDGGLAASLTRPGGNVTGLTGDDPALMGKVLQLLKELMPAASRVAVLAYRPGRGRPKPAWHGRMQEAARTLGLTLIWSGVDTVADYELAFDTIRRERADAIYLAGTAVNQRYQRMIIEFGARHRLAVIADPEVGGLFDYGEDLEAQYRRAAAYVDKILKGAKPGDLPFEQAMTVRLVINLKTAKALGLSIPQSILLRADRVID